MVKKSLSFTLIIFLVLAISNIFANNLYVIIDKNLPSYYENIDISKELSNIFSDVPEKTVRIVHVVGIQKETYSYKVNEFVPDREGTYVYHKGSYYYTSSKAMYKYDSNKKIYVPDPYGLYVYLSDYPWARKEEEKYIISSFYRRYEKYITETSYYIALYITDIDVEKIFVKSVTPIITSGDSFSEALKSTGRLYRENPNKYSSYKVDVAVIFDEKFDKTQRMYILKELQKDTRYNIYDRLYLNELFKTIAFEDLFGKGVFLQFKPPKYMITFENYVERTEKVRSERYYFFENDVNGGYIKKSAIGYYTDVPVRVEIGRYYSYDSKNKTYVLDMEKGNYVRYYGGPWEKETYTSAYGFYDYVLTTVDILEMYTGFLLKVFDTERGTLIGSYSISKNYSTALKEPKDRFGSESASSEYLSKIWSYSNNARYVASYIQKLFPLISMVSSVSDGMVTLSSGENIGIKQGYVFQIIDNGYTSGYVKIDKVFENKSSATALYLIPYEKIYPNTLALETKNYPQITGITFQLFLKDNGFGMASGFTSFDIYGNYYWGILFGAGIEITYEVLEDFYPYMYLEYYNPIFSNLSLFGRFGGKYIELEDIWEIFAESGVRFTSYLRDSIFSPGGTGVYTDVGFGVYFGNGIKIKPTVSFGIDGKF